MTRAELIAEFRQVAGDTRAPHAWADPRVLRWLAEGEDRFCEQTGFFLDTGSYTITTAEGVKEYTVPSAERIIQVNDVWDGDRRLRLFNQRQRPEVSATTTTNTRPTHYQMDRTTGYLTLLESPPEGVVLTLEVWRRAAVSLTSSAATAPEIPVQFHNALVEYAAYKAYNDHDAEKLDQKKANDHYGEFLDYVSQGRRAFSRVHRQTPHVAPNPLYVV